MSEDGDRGLQRLNIEQQLPVGFDQLPEDAQLAILRRFQEKQVDLRMEMSRAVGKSRVAENDLHVHNESVARLDHERKIYTSKISAETGSGKIDMQVRGGDTRFIVPILVVIGVIGLAIVAIIALR